MANINPAQIEKYLKGADFPARKDELVQCARRNGADQQTCDMLQKLPEQQFMKPMDVTKALGNMPQSR